MTLRTSGLIGTFILALILAKTLGSSSISPAAPALPATAQTTNTHSSHVSATAAQVREFYSRAESGLRSNHEIEEEMTKLLADSNPIHWNSHDITHSYKLAIIATHMRNLDNGFEILFLHTLADHGKPENTATYYTTKVNGADEKALRGSFVLARLIEGKKNRRPHFHPDSRRQYFFSLHHDSFAGTFGLREPEGTYNLGAIGEGAFDPLSILSTEDGQIDEVYEYSYERVIAGYTYSIMVVPRLTDYETLVIEVKIREISSLVTTSYVLVYEQI